MQAARSNREPAWAHAPALVVDELELTILMPCLDEARTLGACVDNALRFLERSGIQGEVLVADNGSRDGSRELAEQHGARVILVEERGYGRALSAGIWAARGRYVVMGDSDGSYDMAELSAFVDRLREGYDVVMGNRFRGGIERGAMRPLHRFLGNPVLSGIGRLFFGSACGDFYCGQRGFLRAAALRMDLCSTGMEFALEMLVKASLLRLKVAEIPIVLHPDGRGRRSHLRTWRDGWRSLRLFLLHAPRWLFLYPGLVLMGIGALMGGWLLPRARSFAGVELDLGALLCCSAAMSAGFQLAIFFVFATKLAIQRGLRRKPVRFAWLARGPRLEVSLAVGSLLFLCGLAASLRNGFAWAPDGFTAPDPAAALRPTIPAVLLMTLGCQVVFSSFCLGLLQLPWNPEATRD